MSLHWVGVVFLEAEVAAPVAADLGAPQLEVMYRTGMFFCLECVKTWGPLFGVSLHGPW